MPRRSGDVGARGQRGASRLGCLVLLAALVVIGYVGYLVVESEIAYRAVRETARQQLSLGAERSDEEIRANLSRRADELDLPPTAREIQIRRDFEGRPTVSLHYADTLTFMNRWTWVRQRNVEATPR